MAEKHHPDRETPRPGRPSRDIAGFLIVLLLTVGFYWKLALTRQYDWFDHPDMAYLEIPRLAFQAREIHQGRFPLWDPYLWSGQPLIGQTQPGPLYPFNLLLSLLPLRDGYLRLRYLNLYWVAIHFLAAWFGYLLARDLRLGRAAAVFGGCTFAFAGFVGAVAWLDVVNGAIWAPLVALFLLRGGRGQDTARSAALGGLFLGVSWLSGHHEVPILLSLAAGFTWLWHLARRWRDVRYAALFILIAGLIASAQVIPTFEFGRLSQRWVGLERALHWNDTMPYTMHTLYSFPPKGLLAILFAGYGRFADTSPFAGCVALALALAGIAGRFADRAVRWSTALGAISLSYALGTWTPLNGIFYSLLPVVDKARIPSRALALLGLAIAVLAAFGLDTVLRDPRGPLTRRLRQSLQWGGLLVLAMAFFAELTGHAVDQPVYLGAAAALVAAAVLAGWRTAKLGAGLTASCLIALALVEWTASGPSYFSNHFDPKANQFTKALTNNDDIAAFLRRQPGPPRLVIDEQVIGANFGDWHGIDMLYGYVAGVSHNAAVHELHTRRTQELFGVTHFVGVKPDRPEQQEVFTGTSGIKVYRSPDPLPRARLVHEAKSVASEGHLRIAIQDPATDLRRTALFLGEAPRLEWCESETPVRIVRRTSDHVVLEAEPRCRGLLVYAETMYPGWRARVDGTPVPMWEAYGSLRAVVLEAGRHRIELRFEPQSVFWGAGLATAGLALAAWIIVRTRTT